MLILGLKRLTLSLPECLMEFCKVTLTFQSVDEILWCDHSNESSLPVLTHGAICFSQFWKMKFGNLVETCLWPHLALKGLRKPLKWPASWECHLIIILNRLTNVKVNNLLSGGGGGHLYGLYGDMPLDRLWFLSFLSVTVHLISWESVLTRVHNFVRGYCLYARFDLLDEFCLNSKDAKAMTFTWICSIAITSKWPKNKTACSLSLACEQQTHFPSSLLSLRKIAVFRRERSDHRVPEMRLLFAG